MLTFDYKQILKHKPQFSPFSVKVSSGISGCKVAENKAIKQFNTVTLYFEVIYWKWKHLTHCRHGNTLISPLYLPLWFIHSDCCFMLYSKIFLSQNCGCIMVVRNGLDPVETHDFSAGSWNQYELTSNPEPLYWWESHGLLHYYWYIYTPITGPRVLPSECASGLPHKRIGFHYTQHTIKFLTSTSGNSL